MPRQKRGQGERVIEIQMPVQGIHRKLSYQQQPPFTTPDALNVVPIEYIEERMRCGRRAGLTRTFVTNVGEPAFIAELTSVYPAYSTEIYESRNAIYPTGDSNVLYSGDTRGEMVLVSQQTTDQTLECYVIIPYTHPVKYLVYRAIKKSYEQPIYVYLEHMDHRKFGGTSYFGLHGKAKAIITLEVVLYQALDVISYDVLHQGVAKKVLYWFLIDEENDNQRYYLYKKDLCANYIDKRYYHLAPDGRYYSIYSYYQDVSPDFDYDEIRNTKITTINLDSQLSSDPQRKYFHLFDIDTGIHTKTIHTTPIDNNAVNVSAYYYPWRLPGQLSVSYVSGVLYALQNADQSTQVYVTLNDCRIGDEQTTYYGTLTVKISGGNTYNVDFANFVVSNSSRYSNGDHEWCIQLDVLNDRVLFMINGDTVAQQSISQSEKSALISANISLQYTTILNKTGQHIRYCGYGHHFPRTNVSYSALSRNVVIGCKVNDELRIYRASGGNTLTPLSLSGVTFPTDRTLTAVEYLQKLYVAATDGTPLVVDTKTASVTRLTATAGEVPEQCPVITRFNDRIVLCAADHIWYMSRQGDPTDWDFGADPYDVRRAVAGQNSEAGTIGDPIVAAVPYLQDFLIFFATNNVWMMAGSPTMGGRIQCISYNTGIVGTNAWTYGAKNEIFFLGHKGLYVISGTQGDLSPIPLSLESIPQELIGFNREVYTPHLHYDYTTHGIYIFVVSRDRQYPSQTWFFDLQSNGFWKLRLDADHVPVDAMLWTPATGDPPKLLMIGRDGFIRHFAKESSTDDGVPIENYLYLGAIELSGHPLYGALLKEIHADLDMASGGIQIEVRTGDAPERAFSSEPRFSADLTAGYNFTVRPRVHGRSLYLVLRGTGDNAWAIDGLRIVTQPLGVMRHG